MPVSVLTVIPFPVTVGAKFYPLHDEILGNTFFGAPSAVVPGSDLFKAGDVVCDFNRMRQFWAAEDRSGAPSGGNRIPAGCPYYLQGHNDRGKRILGFIPQVVEWAKQNKTYEEV